MSRVGRLFQAEIPCATKEATEERKDLDGQLLWEGRRLRPSVVRKFLRFGRHLFGSDGNLSYPSLFCEERGLYLLHACGYDVKRALSLMCPIPTPEPESDADESYDGDDHCFICRDGGNLLLCDSRGCKKAYHPACLRMESVPTGSWMCPRHFCLKCETRVDTSAQSAFKCSRCPNSYCSTHLPKRLGARASRQAESRSDSYEFLCEECLMKEAVGPQASTRKERRRFFRRLLALLQEVQVPIFEHIPHIASKEVDLFLLYTEVTKRGGLAFMDADAWESVRNALAIPANAPNAVHLLRLYYRKYLTPYEEKFFEGAEEASNAAPRRTKKRPREA